MKPVRSTLVFILVVMLMITMSWTKPVNVRAASSLASPIILTTSETVLAGETMDIQGGGFTLTSTSWIQRINSDGTADTSNRYQMVVANQSPYLIQAVVPSNMPAGLWSVTVVNSDGSTSNPKYVHQARGNGYDNQEVAAGSVLRIWGRNLVAPGGDFHASYATFTVGTTVLNAPATVGDAFSMTITVPASVAVGALYTVKVSNGLGGSTGENIVPYPLAIRTGGADPFSLGVPWGADFTFASNIYNVTSDPRLSMHAVGDGTTDNLPAIQAASLTANRAGGGVLYFPAGTFLLDNANASLRIYPNVVLEGAGQANTKLTYGLHPSVSQYFAIMDDAGKIGFKDLTVQDLNTGSVQTNALVDQYAAETTEIFFKDITFNLGTSTGPYVVGCLCNKGLMSGSTVTNQAPSGGGVASSSAVSFSGTDIEFKNNSVTYGGGRNVFSADNVTVENSSFRRLGSLDYPEKHEDGGLEVSRSRNLQFIHNNVQIVPPLDQSIFAYGSDDLFLTQTSVFNTTRLGMVSSATASTLSDATADWSAQATLYPYHGSGPEFNNLIVAINGGTGMGQWRNVVSNDAHTLTLDRPWDIVPDLTSSYVITVWMADRFLIEGNTFANDKGGMFISDGTNDSVIVGNTMTNSAGITLMGLHYTSVPAPGQANDLTWNNLILNNTVTSDPNSMRPATIYVGVWEGYPDGEIEGNVTLDNEVRGNSITTLAPPTTNGPVQLPGYYNYIQIGGASYIGSKTLGIIGSIFENNTASNTPLQPYVSLGTSQNTAHYAGEPVSMPCLTLKLADRPADNQATAGVQVKYFKVGTEELDARTENWPSAAGGRVVLNDPFLVGQQTGQWSAYPMRFRDNGTYDVWIKAPGFLAKKITGVTHVQSQCIPMSSGLLAGDFTTDDQNTITLGDIVTFIRAFDGGTDSAANLVPQAFGGILTINNLVTIIRRFIETPNGDAA